MIARIAPWLVWGTAAAAAVSLGVAAGPVVWRSAGQDGTITTVAGAPAAAMPDRPDLAPILDFAPFGSADAPAPEPRIAGETTLGLTLLGVTIAVPATESRAIIGGGDGAPESHSIGASVTDTARLVEVHTGFVVLDVGGRLETLSFTAPPPGTAPVAVALPETATDTSPETSPETSMEPDAVIARYRAAIHQNPQRVMDRLGLEITSEGYRITEGAAKGVLLAGFWPGDLVTTVNGQKVGDIDADRRYFDVIAASGKARVEIKRDGQTIVMTFPLR